ncbi:hypothetical protein D3C71_1611090 [compost metagenome]
MHRSGYTADRIDDHQGDKHPQKPRHQHLLLGTHSPCLTRFTRTLEHSRHHHDDHGKHGNTKQFHDSGVIAGFLAQRITGAHDLSHIVNSSSQKKACQFGRKLQ